MSLVLVSRIFKSFIPRKIREITICLRFFLAVCFHNFLLKLWIQKIREITTYIYLIIWTKCFHEIFRLENATKLTSCFSREKMLKEELLFLLE